MYKHSVSKACSSRYSKAKEEFGSQPRKAGTTELGIVHKSSVFVHSLSGRKNLLRTSLFFPLGEKDKVAHNRKTIQTSPAGVGNSF